MNDLVTGCRSILNNIIQFQEKLGEFDDLMKDPSSNHNECVKFLDDMMCDIADANKTLISVGRLCTIINNDLDELDGQLDPAVRGHVRKLAQAPDFINKFSEKDLLTLKGVEQMRQDADDSNPGPGRSRG